MTAVYRVDYAQVWANGWNWIDSHTIIVPPPAPGTIDASIPINSALVALNANGGGELQLLDGDYELYNAINLLSYTSLYGKGGRAARLIPKGTWNGVDTPTNALVQGKGTLSGSAIAVTQDKNIGVTSLKITSTATLSPGDYILAMSPAAAGSPIIRYEILQVDTITNGTDFTLKYPTLLPYTSAASPTVQKITPVFNVGVYELEIDASSVPNLAVGILLRNCLGVEVELVGGYYVSRSVVNLDQGSTDIDVANITGRGSNNGLVFLDSVHNWSVRDVENLRNATGRLHPLGLQRGLVHGRNQPTSGILSSCTLFHGGIGVNFWGGYDIDFTDIEVRDMDSSGTGGAWDRLVTASPAEGTGFGGGTGISVLCTTSPLTEHTYDLSFKGCKIVNCKTNSLGYHWYCGDVHNLKIADLAILNYLGAATGSYGGMGLADVFGGTIEKLHVQGIARGLVQLNNGFVAGVVDTYIYDPTFGDGLTYVPVQNDNSVASGMKINKLISSNLSAGSEQRMRFGSGFVGDGGMIFSNFDWEPSWSGDAILARDPRLSTDPGPPVPFVLGDIVEIYGDTSGNRLVREASATTNEFGIVLQNGSLGNDADAHGYMVVIPIRNMHRCTMVNVTAGVVSHSDRLVWDAANPRKLKVDNNATNAFLILARADSYRASGSALVTVTSGP